MVVDPEDCDAAKIQEQVCRSKSEQYLSCYISDIFCLDIVQLVAAYREMTTQNLQQKQKKGANVDHTNHKFWAKQVCLEAPLQMIMPELIISNVIVNCVQPVLQFMDEPVVDVNEPIDPVKTVAEIRQVGGAP